MRLSKYTVKTWCVIRSNLSFEATDRLPGGFIELRASDYLQSARLLLHWQPPDVLRCPKSVAASRSTSHRCSGCTAHTRNRAV